MKLGKLLFRCDGSPELGFGHINRSLTIAQWMRGKFDIAIVAKKHKSISGLRRKTGYKIHYLDENIKEKEIPAQVSEIVREWQPKVVINDVKDTTQTYMQSIQDIKVKTVNFDDLGPGGEMADVLIDANRRENKKKFFGPNYVVLHSDYVKENKKAKKPHKIVRNLAISIGGGDPNGYTEKLLDCLEERDKHFNTVVVLGPTFENGRKLKEKFKYHDRVHFLEKLDTLVKPLSWADIAIVNGGITMFESVAVGTPTLVLSQNEDELKNVKRLERKEAVLDIGLGEKLSVNKLSKRLVKICDDFDYRKKLIETGKER